MDDDRRAECRRVESRFELEANITGDLRLKGRCSNDGVRFAERDRVVVEQIAFALQSSDLVPTVLLRASRTRVAELHSEDGQQLFACQVTGVFQLGVDLRIAVAEQIRIDAAHVQPTGAFARADFAAAPVVHRLVRAADPPAERSIGIVEQARVEARVLDVLLAGVRSVNYREDFRQWDEIVDRLRVDRVGELVATGDVAFQFVIVPDLGDVEKFGFRTVAAHDRKRS